MRRRGSFITFEGGDGCGKSTQIQLALDWLKKQGYDVILTREPGGTEVGEKIREILLDPENEEISNMTEMLLYAAARAQLAHEVIQPMLDKGRIVVCDRWADSSLVYQGVARELGDSVRIVNTMAAGGLFSPDGTILLDMDPEFALARTGSSAGKNGQDRIEALGLDYHKKVRAAYLNLAKQEPRRIHVIDASGSQKEVHSLVIAALTIMLGGER